MKETNKKVILITYIGIIPFYFTPLAMYFDHYDRFKEILNIENVSFFYSTLIISFLSGMQWQKMIIQNEKNLLFVPLIPLILVLASDFHLFSLYQSSFIVFSLFFSLIIDLKIIKKNYKLWFKKLRINATILASISFLL